MDKGNNTAYTWYIMECSVKLGGHTYCPCIVLARKEIINTCWALCTYGYYYYDLSVHGIVHVWDRHCSHLYKRISLCKIHV